MVDNVTWTRTTLVEQHTCGAVSVFKKRDRRVCSSEKENPVHLLLKIHSSFLEEKVTTADQTWTLKILSWLLKRGAYLYFCEVHECFDEKSVIGFNLRKKYENDVIHVCKISAFCFTLQTLKVYRKINKPDMVFIALIRAKPAGCR